MYGSWEVEKLKNADIERLIVNKKAMAGSQKFKVTVISREHFENQVWYSGRSTTAGAASRPVAVPGARDIVLPRPSTRQIMLNSSTDSFRNAGNTQSCCYLNHDKKEELRTEAESKGSELTSAKSLRHQRDRTRRVPILKIATRKGKLPRITILQRRIKKSIYADS